MITNQIIFLRTNFSDSKEFAQFNEDTQAIYENYKEKYVEVLGQLYEYGLKEHEKREDEISALQSSISKEIEIATKRARQYVFYCCYID